MKISAVIPTKNRPDDLLKAIKSILLQIILPDQLIIIDQSENSQSLNLTNKIGLKDKIDLTYILDPKILGLVHAKHESLKYVRCDLVSFLEDDIVLEKNYFKEKKDAFKQFSNMLGCSGTIINATSKSFIYRFFYRMNHKGIFKDSRPDLFVKLNNSDLKFANSSVINGGLSSWKKSIFNEFKFDTLNNFHMMEDFEFSKRVSKKYPKSLFIISKARLYHYPSPVNRDKINKVVERKTYEYVVFFKKNKKNIYDYLSFLILILGLFLNEFLKSLYYFNFRILVSFFHGLNRGFFYKIKY